ncbi:MAG: hypothetical protein OXP75_19340 [Rhodospirillales bacterium]|nr:hypothetical protein [Rhodospirillales bacterium]
MNANRRKYTKQSNQRAWLLIATAWWMKSSIVVLPVQRLPTMQLKPSSQAGASVGRNVIGVDSQIEGIISGLVAFRRSPLPAHGRTALVATEG